MATTNGDALDLTPTEQRIYDKMLDGKPYSKLDLHACLWDERSNVNTVRFHLSKLRQKIKPDRDVLVEYISGRLHYRLIAHIDCLKPTR